MARGMCSAVWAGLRYGWCDERRGRTSAGQQLAAALLQRAVGLQPVHDPVQRRRVHAELRTDLADGDARTGFDKLEQLVTATVGAAAVASGTGARGRAPPCAPTGPTRTRGHVSGRRRRDPEPLRDLLELPVLVDQRAQLRHPPGDPVLQALQIIDD